MEKLTYAKALEIAIETVEDEATREKLVALKKTLEKPQKKKVNTEKLELAQKVLELMDFEIKYILGDLARELEVSTQKLAPTMKVLIDEGKVEKTVEKRKTYYTRVE